MNDRPKNLAKSVRDRLMNHARSRGEEFQFVLTRFALERLLYRITQSAHRQVFVLKGAMLFSLWTKETHRPTKDLDLLGFGEPAISRFQDIFREVCVVDVEADGLVFHPDSVQAAKIKEDQDYEGIRVTFFATLERARIPLQIDIGFGDTITPGAVSVDYPTILEFPAPALRAYPRETVVAEKYQAMVMLGIANSRMKDFYDLWVMAKTMDFDGQSLSSAIRATFEHRKTAIPAETTLALTATFTEDAGKQTQWRAFVRKSKLQGAGVELPDVAILLQSFLMPPSQSMTQGSGFTDRWQNGGPWK